MSGGGGEGIVAKVAGMGNQTQSNNSMPVYGANTPVRTTADANRYTSTYAPMQQTPQQSTQNVSQNIQNMGLEALYQSMANQFAPISQQFNPMDRFYQQPMQQMPTYQSQALSYRPDMANAQQNLSRVSPSVVLQQRQAAEEAAKQAAQAAANPRPVYSDGASGE